MTYNVFGGTLNLDQPTLSVDASASFQVISGCDLGQNRGTSQ